MIAKSFDAGWGGVVAKTVSLDSAKVVNVVPRYGRLRSRDTGEIIGFENIELISDRPFDVWLDEFAAEERVPEQRPDRLDHGGVRQGALAGTDAAVQETGVDAFELNFSCPHGMPERRMGSEMGEHPDLTEEVTAG